LFRSYDSLLDAEDLKEGWVPPNSGSANLEPIWQVARATTAVPRLFPPMVLDDTVYLDGGMVANNPSHLALREVASFYKGKLDNICLVSIGSGLSPKGNTRADASQWKISPFRELTNTIDMLKKLATETEFTQNSVSEASTDNKFPYFRFNVEFPRKIYLDEYVQGSKASGKRQGTFEAIEQYTQRHLERQEISAILIQCAANIVSSMIRHPQDSSSSQSLNTPLASQLIFVQMHQQNRCVKSALTMYLDLRSRTMSSELSRSGP
jgi:Patatin-like phospholipase